NKMFHFFEDARVRAARRRASTLRGLARQLGTGSAIDVAVSVSASASASGEEVLLTYRIGEVRLARRVELSAAEYAAVAYVVRRAGSRVLDEARGAYDAADERAHIDAALARLAVGLRLNGAGASADTIALEPIAD